jgi:colanic acid/amylovoran biosynthesis protein
MMPQSVGPIRFTNDEKAIKFGLRRVSPIVVRDHDSLAVVEHMFPERSDIVVCPDVVFAESPSTHKDISFRYGPSPRIGIVVMDWQWAHVDSEQDFNRYIGELRSLIRTLVARGNEVVLWGNSRMPEENQDDFQIAGRIIAGLHKTESNLVSVLNSTSDLDVLMKELEEIDILVGTRLHSCIFGLIAGVPSIALAYQPKAIGTYRILGLADMCFDVRTFKADDIATKIDALLKETDSARDRVVRSVTTAKHQIDILYASLFP